MKSFCNLSETGFTLIEILVAMVISGVLMTGVYSAFKSQQDSFIAQEQVVEMQQNLRAATELLIQDIRSAGYDRTHSAGAGIVTATPGRLGFTKDLNADGTVDSTVASGESVTYGFSLANDATADGIVDSSASASLGKNSGTATGVGGSGFQPIAENFNAVEFRYLDENNNVTSVLDNIHSIQISLLAVARRPDNNYMNSKTYQTLSGVTWGPYNDHFRRRFQAVTILCRNMGL